MTQKSLYRILSNKIYRNRNIKLPYKHIVHCVGLGGRERNWGQCHIFTFCSPGDIPYLPSSLIAGNVSLNQALNSFSAIHGCFFVMAVLSQGSVPEVLEVLSHGLVPEPPAELSHGFVPEVVEELSHGLVPELLLSHGLVPEELAVVSQGRDILLLLSRHCSPSGKSKC